jgi:hypothetical protein
MSAAARVILGFTDDDHFFVSQTGGEELGSIDPK